MADYDEIANKPVYMISVAAKLTGMHPQTLRIYERKRLLTPGRTPKATRLYSQRDIDRLKYIQQLTHEGVSLAGVKIIMDLQNELEGVREMLARVEKLVVETEDRLADETAKSARFVRHELSLIRKGELMRRK